MNISQNIPIFALYSLIMYKNSIFTKASWAKLVLKKDGYDPFIDFLKGVCIIFVIINHCMPEIIMKYSGFMFWGVSAVPIFLLIQVFHAYKRGCNNTKVNYKRVWNKIALPFFICQIIICIAFILKSHHAQLSNIIADISNWIKSGGYGPGAYYPWIYLQFTILLPLLSPIFRKSSLYLCISFIIISQSVETACAYFHLPQLAYRLLFLRYIFIFYLGYLLATKGYQLNRYTFGASIICLLFSFIIVYGGINLSPFLYDFVNPVCHWFCYVYIAYLLLFLLKIAYGHIPNGSFQNYLLDAGKYSYEIFLFQIVYFAIADECIFEYLGKIISNHILFSVVKTVLPIFICTLPIILYKRKRSLPKSL